MSEMTIPIPAPPFLAARGLTKTYRRKGGPEVAVLDNLAFDLSRGDKVAILGKSGAGKSTFLHILGTLEKPTAGTLHFGGKDLLHLSEGGLSRFRNARLGFVFQFHYLMLEFSALENVMMPALIAGLPTRDAKAQAMTILEKVGLQDRVHHRPSQLSGGEQSRVAIARALVMNPQLLLTDEMTGNLDAATGRQVFDLIQSLYDEYKMAMISVTHDEALAAEYHQIWKLEAGTLHRLK